MRLYSASVSPTTLAGAASMRLLIRGYRYLWGEGGAGPGEKRRQVGEAGSRASMPNE